MQHIVIAPNAFKHSLDALGAAEALREGFLQSRLDCKISLFPIGDGGDGTCKLIRQHLGGTEIVQTVSGPLGKPTHASYSLIDEGKAAVIEMADASGIRLLLPEERAPLQASSVGTGQLILSALDHGVEHIILGMGGSATVDGGCGMLHALGLRFFDREGGELDPIPQELQRLHHIDLSGKDKRLDDCTITILCDVENTLLGEHGAAAVFGPQKGASEPAVKMLETFLSLLSKIAMNSTGKDMTTVVSGGAAGGAAAGMYAFANAQLVNGIDHFLKLTGFEEVLQTADWLVTGEGSLDEQTLSGKGPCGVAHLAKQHRIPVIGIAGRVPLVPSPELLDLFDVLLPISHEAMPLQKALEYTSLNLQRTAHALGNMLALRTKNCRG